MQAPRNHILLPEHRK